MRGLSPEDQGSMKNWLYGGVGVGLILGAIYFADRADHRADVAEGRVLVADSLRKAAETKSRADSLALESQKASYTADSVRFAAERSRMRLEAVRLRESTQTASDALRSVLDVQGQVLLDSLDAAHASELTQAHRETAQADSATVVERTLRIATEEALVSERLAHQSAASEIAALRSQVQALKSAHGRGKLLTGGVIALVGAVIILR